MPQGLALDALHDDETAVAAFSNAVNGDDVRIVEVGDGADFLEKLFDALPGSSGHDEFQGDRALELRVVGAVHRAHSSAAQDRFDPKVGNAGPEQPVFANGRRRQRASVRNQRVSIDEGPF